MRKLLGLVVVVAFVAVALGSGAPAQASASRASIAILSTGIAAERPEFAAGQVVAWRDFVDGHAAPFDDDGAGTSLAFAAAGVALPKAQCGGARPWVADPGAPLVVARVLNATSGAIGDYEAAIAWAMEQGVSVILLDRTTVVGNDFGNVMPTFATSRGILVVNLPTSGPPVWTQGYGDDADVITVGSAPQHGFASGAAPSAPTTPDADVVSWSGACSLSRVGGAWTYASGSSSEGSVFASIAARAVDEAAANGRSLDGVGAGALLLATARNAEGTPYVREGLGMVGPDELPTILQHAANGTAPDYDAQGPWAAQDRQHRDTVVAFERARVYNKTLSPTGPAWVGGNTTPTTTPIAILDSGVDASHPEFEPGQIVAWRDFTDEASPTPIDRYGHGTATASLLAGRDVGSCSDAPKMSFARGAPLIVARVLDSEGVGATATIDQALGWALDQTPKPRVVSMSLGGLFPLASASFPNATRARAEGVLLVVAVGNGAANTGLLPMPSETQAYGSRIDVLGVGGATRAGESLTSTTGNLDPDVVSWSDAVCVAMAGTTKYRIESGTSFATPLVAGMAAKAMQIADEHGMPADADRIERLLLLSARNTATSPYAREGMGFLLDSEWASLEQHAAAGTLPDYDAQGPWAAADRHEHDDAQPLVHAVEGPLEDGLNENVWSLLE